MAGKTAPFAKFEWMIAWRYMRAKRETGGVSIMTWISLIGVTLAVFALIAVLAVRSGFRADFVDTIVGASAHLTVRENFMETVTVTQGDQSVDVTRRVQTIANGDGLAAQLLQQGQYAALRYGCNFGDSPHLLGPARWGVPARARRPGRHSWLS